MSLNTRFHNARRAGFTLIELVVVVAILVVLSGLVLPKLDGFKLKANKGVAAANMAGVNRFVESYRIQKDLFPDSWDSLLDATTPTALFAELDPQLVGPVVSGIPASPEKLTTTTIATADELRSLNRVGLVNVHDHNTGGFPSNSANAPARALAVGDTVATINAADPDGLAIINAFYPQGGGVPIGKKLVVMGLGPLNQMIGKTLHTAPFYANTDQLSYYARFLMVFEISTSGGRARMLSSLGADADRLDEEVQDYYELDG